MSFAYAGDTGMYREEEKQHKGTTKVCINSTMRVCSRKRLYQNSTDSEKSGNERPYSLSPLDINIVGNLRAEVLFAPCLKEQRAETWIET
jgi:hypothetical protein